MSWNIDQLTAFVNTCEQGSFSAAARQLNKSQSRISEAVANLEIDLGVTLFDRTGRYPKLTTQGQQLLTQARAVLAQCTQLDAVAGNLAINRETEIKIAVDEAIPHEAYFYALLAIADRFPGVKLTLLNGTQGDIANYVEQQQVTLGLINSFTPVSSGLECSNIGLNHFVAVTSKEHLLAKQAEVSMADLVHHRQFVICDKQGQAYFPALSANHWLFDNYYFTIPAIEQNLGWAVLPARIAAEYASYYIPLVELEIKETTPWSNIPITLIKRADTATGPVFH